MTKPGAQWSDDQLDEMIRRMGEGETLTSISSDPRMPSMASMMRWEEEQDTDLGARITQARATRRQPTRTSTRRSNSNSEQVVR